MIIETYKTLEEKSNFFDCTTINSKEEFKKLANYWTDSKESPSLDTGSRYIFRGLTEAKYKLFNSAQRYWMGQELYELGRSYPEFIQSLIDNAKTYQANLLVKYYDAFGHPPYDLSILSFLQHYGAPTPLLDFTYRFDSAAFFAIDGLEHNPSIDIDNYCSIYSIDTTLTARIFPSILDHISSSLSQIDDILERNKDKKIDTTKVLENIRGLKYEAFQGLKLFHIPGYIPNGYSFKLKGVPHFNLVLNQHNLNIINQAGLFVFNSDALNPLEYLFTDQLEIGKTFHIPKIKCWNIHKSLQEYIFHYLTQNRPFAINREFMFPQEELIARDAFLKFKNFS
jgi:hypothetical protein